LAAVDDPKGFYRLLEVPAGASQDEIKKSYRKLARMYHPDANPGNPEAEEHFKLVNEAYAVLGDPEKREQYDRFGTVGNGGGGYGPFSGQDPFGDIFGDLFDTFMGGGSRARANAPRQGSDLEVSLNVSLREAAAGVTKKVNVARRERCEKCGGTGAQPGTHAESCRDCGGRGQVEQAARTPFGQFVTVVPCARCGGTGRVIKSPCTECRGEGQKRVKRELEVRVPPGVDTGVRLRVNGGGEAGINGGPPGDLYVHLEVEPDPLFIRDGNDLHTQSVVSFPQAVLGCQVEVSTLYGLEKKDLPAGTRPGDTFRLKGKGMPRLRGGGRGDLIVHVDVDVPKNLTEKAKKLVEDLASEMGTPVQPAGFLDRLKTWLS
jgi:molecular chaperone DnaJ